MSQVITWIGDQKLDVIGCQNYDANVVAVSVKDKWGLMDDKGKMITSMEYDSIEKIKQNACCIKKKGLWGLYDYEKKSLLVPCKYQRIKHFESEIVGVMSNGKWGCFSIPKKAMITGFKYDSIHECYENLAFVYLNKIQYKIEADGEEVAASDLDGTVYTEYPPSEHKYFGKYGEGEKLYRNNFWVVRQNDKKGLVNNDGQEILPLLYDNIQDFGSSAIAYLDKKQTIVDANGKQIMPLSKLVQNSSTCSSIIYDIDGKLGMNNEKGYPLLTPTFENILMVRDKKIGIKGNPNGYEFIDCIGQKIGTDTYEGLIILGNLFFIKQKGKWRLASYQ
jgi:hypothetical protein